MGQVRNLPTSGFKKVTLQESHTKVTSGSTGEAGREICSFRIHHGLRPSQTPRACERSPNTQRECRARKGKRRTRQWKQNTQGRAHQLRKWRKQDCWIQFAGSMAWRMKPTTRFQLIRRYTCQPHTDYRARERAPTSVDKTTDQSKVEIFGLD